MKILERLFNKVKEDGDCLIFTGATRPSGQYGVLRIGKKIYSCHRIVYKHLFGEIPDDKVVDHICNNKACVNPFHLRLLSHWENSKRGNCSTAINVRKTKCPKQHEYDSFNKYGRSCSKCNILHRKNSYMKQKLKRNLKTFIKLLLNLEKIKK